VTETDSRHRHPINLEVGTIRGIPAPISALGESSARRQGAQAIPIGTVISVEDIIGVSESIGGFLMILGGIIAGIVIIASGIRYVMAGATPQGVAAAKGMLKAGIIGALVIFGVGVIISTVRTVSENPLQFF
jgi:hypothetical protein